MTDRPVVSFDPRTIGRHMPSRRHQKGHIKRLSAGRYFTRWYQYRIVDGAEKRVCRERIITRETAAEVGLKLDYEGPISKGNASEVLRLLIQRDTGQYVADARATVADLARQYIAIARPNWGAHQIRGAENRIKTHIIGKLGGVLANDVDAVRLQGWLNEYVEADASKSLLKHLLTDVRCIFDLAVARKIVSSNPAKDPACKLKAKSRKRVSDRTLTLDEVRKLLAASIGRDHVILRLLVQIGLRPEELWALRRDDFRGDRLRVDEVLVGTRIEQRAKTQESETDAIYVPPELARLIREWLECSPGLERDFLFPGERGGAQNSPNYLKRVMKPLAVRAGVATRDTGKRDTDGRPVLTSDVEYRVLRRTCATLFGQRAKDPRTTQHQMRHTDPAMTLRVYQQAIPAEVQIAAIAFESDLGPKTPAKAKEN